MSQPIQPCSVTLKISKSSVMLYANRYLRHEGEPGATAQQYLASFATRCTDIPPAFDAILRQATAGQPGRYRQLCQRIEERVLVPARRQAQAEALKKSWVQLAQYLEDATEQLQQAQDLPHFDELIAHPAMQVAVQILVGQARRALRPQSRLQTSG